MKVKSLSETKIILLISAIVLGVGVLLTGLFYLLGYSSEIKLYFAIGIGIGLIIFIINSIIRLKKNGVIYDERDNYIEKETNSISFTVFQIILSVFVLATYRLGDIEINVSVFALLLFFVMWMIYGIVYLFVKKRS